jgi:hypothetical protein
VARLLHRSPEARAVLEQLQENARKVRQLPQHQLGPDFAAQVLGKIQEACLQPASSAAAPASVPLPRRVGWLGWGLAAAVLLMVSGGSYLLVSTMLKGSPQSGPGPLVINLQKDKDSLEPKKTTDPMVANLIEGVFSNFGKEIPEIGTRIALKDLDAQQLRKETAIRVDVSMRNNPRESVDRLAEAFRKTGIKVLVDGSAKAGLKKGKSRTEYLVFAENINADELANILRQLNGQVSDSVLLNPLTAEHRQQVAGLMKVEASKLQPTPFIDIKIIPKNLTDGGKKVKKGDTNPVVTPAPDRFAVVLATTPGSGGLSNEVRQFLNSRHGNRPGTLQVVVVLHQT